MVLKRKKVENNCIKYDFFGGQNNWFIPKSSLSKCKHTLKERGIISCAKCHWKSGILRQAA
ncbi:hypothetical protein JOC76_000649 [Neobacillus cucumis]|nr:hypothetical protein [Neobacillus cucumis]